MALKFNNFFCGETIRGFKVNNNGLIDRIIG
jgi:hypothetical protein